MAIIASVAHAVLAASSAGVCAILGAGNEHTQVSARAEINRKNTRCMVVPFLPSNIEDALLAQACSFVDTMHNAVETASASGSERSARGLTKCGTTTGSLCHGTVDLVTSV
jgi:hypothetical protein